MGLKIRRWKHGVGSTPNALQKAYWPDFRPILPYLGVYTRNYRLRTGPRHAHPCFIPAAMRVTWYGKSERNGHLYPFPGDGKDIIPPPKGGGNSGKPLNRFYTDKVRGSSPFAPTKSSPFEEVFAYISLYIWGWWTVSIDSG
jgi:hypothetical protein